jgi:hypothetical protein
MRKPMNNAYGASGATVGGSGTVPNNGGTSKGNPVRKGIGVVLNPTVTFLVLLVLMEYGTLLLLRRTFKHAHGG